MADLVEVPNQFDAAIYQLETNDPVLGGVDGIDNAQGKALANRTRFLKDAIDGVVTAGGGVPDNIDPTNLLAALQSGFGMAEGPDSINTYSVLAGGRIIQSGRVLTSIGGISTHLFPLAFPNNVFCVVGSVAHSQSVAQSASLTNHTLTGFDVATLNANSNYTAFYVYYIAFGN